MREGRKIFLQKWFALLLVLAVLTAMAGCKAGNNGVGDGSDSQGSSKEEAGKDSGNAEEEINLVIWSSAKWKGVFDADEEGADYDSFFKEAIRRYQTEHPNVNITVEIIPGDSRDEKLNIALKSNSLPDIMFESTFTMSSFVYKNAIVALDDIVTEEAREDISEGMWENCTAEGHIFCYPFSNQPGTLVYNANMFREAGLDQYIGDEYGIVTWSVEELETILRTLKEKLPNIYPMSLYAKNNQADTWTLAYLRMFGNDFFDADGRLIVNQESGVQAAQFLKDLYDEGLTVPGAESLSSNDCNALFINGQVAISFTNNILLGTQKQEMETIDPNADIRLANIPGKDNPLTFTYVTGGMAMNTGDPVRIAAAKDFIQYFSTDPELVIASKNGLPVRASVAEKVKDEMPYLDALSGNEQYLFDFSRNIAGYTELRNTLFPEMQALLIGEKTAQQAMDDYTENGNKVIEESEQNAVCFQ